MKKWISWLSVVLGVFPFLILLWPLDLNSGIKYPRDVAGMNGRAENRSQIPDTVKSFSYCKNRGKMYTL